MNFCIKTGDNIYFTGDKWSLRADFSGDGDPGKRLLTIRSNNYPDTGETGDGAYGGLPIIDIFYDCGRVTADILFYGNGVPGMPVRLEAYTCETRAERICVYNTPNRVALYINGNLTDEDWPLGSVPFENSVCEVSAGNWELRSETDEDNGRAHCENITGIPGGESGGVVTNIQNWRPEGHNTGVGDCMPFFHDGVFHLFYLFDRRGHKSKRGLGAHQWAHISTVDLINWTRHPMAVAIDSQWEGSICTGSTVFHNGIYYAFYAVRMSDGSAARLTWASGSDCVAFTKSNRYFELGEPYDAQSARDPFVFFGADGTAHMFVTTSIKTEGGNMGCLAHLASSDLLCWTPLDPLVIRDSADQPECPDYFRIGDLYYLIYSIRGTAGYYMSDYPFGPWRRPVDNVVIGEGCRVPKTAKFGDNRIIAAGFIVDPPGRGYAGRVYFNELIQKCDGTFDFVVPEEMDG